MPSSRRNTPIRVHAPLDSSCIGIEAEEIEYSDYYGLELEHAMKDTSIARLNLIYPELTFTLTLDKPTPKTYLCARKTRNGWLAASWRTV